MKITYKTPTKIILNMLDLAVRNGKSFSDITDVLYMLKNNQADQDTDAVFSKSVKISGITLNVTDKTADVTLAVIDFGINKIASGGRYLICIGVEFNDSLEYIEDYDPRFENKMEIIRDKIRA